MIRLHLVVEGQAEEEFVNSVLVEHLGQFQISTDARCVLTSRNRSRIYRGGLSKFQRAQRDLVLWMKEDQNSDARFSTMFDCYRLPHDFPGYDEARRRTDPYDRVMILEEALGHEMGDSRFIPYLQLHEFEALLLSDPAQLDCEFLEHDRAIQELTNICSNYASPELIDDGPETAPSKRIIAQIPQYCNGSRFSLL